MPELKVDIVAASLASTAESWVDKLVAERVAAAPANQDPTLWGRQVQPEAARRLAWLGLPRSGHQNGVFLQLTGAVDIDIPPRTDFTLGQLQRAQALGDAQVLAAHGRPVLWLHLRDRPAGLVALMHAVQELG
jgi:hypothetical protein